MDAVEVTVAVDDTVDVAEIETVAVSVPTVDEDTDADDVGEPMGEFEGVGENPIIADEISRSLNDVE